MVKKKLKHEDDDSIMASLKVDQQEYEETILKKYKKPSTKGNGIPAKSAMAAGGRKCMRCSDQLYIKEETKNEIIVVYCKNCGLEMHHTDLEMSDSTDHMYRHIPDEMMIRYTQARADEKERKARKGY